jgi:glycosyltransferase involved in cell wall biosynthesis
VSTERETSNGTRPLPSLSVVIPTRNRAEHAAACVVSVLGNSGFDEVVVVDQSDDRSTELALAKLADPRVVHVGTPSRGVSNGRNLGVERTRGDIIAFTDDDCRPASDWVANIRHIFASDADTVVVCGRVAVANEVRNLGYTESFEPHEREWRNRLPPFGRDWGITANLAVRREAFERVGRFDPLLGAGAPLRAGEEPDFLFRVLTAGYKVVNAREVSVDHLGVRKVGPETQRLIRGYGLGTGAAFFKHVRLGDRAAAGVYARFVVANAERAFRGLLEQGRPVGLGYLFAFLAGSVESYRFAIDRERREYIERAR